MLSREQIGVLAVLPRSPKRGCLWLTDGSCVRLRPQQPNHFWSYDFIEDRTYDGRKFRLLSVLDEFTHECLTIQVGPKLKAADVIHDQEILVPEDAQRLLRDRHRKPALHIGISSAWNRTRYPKWIGTRFSSITYLNKQNDEAETFTFEADKRA